MALNYGKESKVGPVVQCQGCGFVGLFLNDGHQNGLRHGGRPILQQIRHSIPISEMRSESGKRNAENFVLNAVNPLNETRRDRIREYEEAGLLSTGRASEILGITRIALQAAIRKGRLNAQFIDLEGDIRGEIKKLGGPTMAMIKFPDLDTYAHNMFRIAPRRRAIVGVAAYLADRDNHKT